jgi:hypothetical protein
VVAAAWFYRATASAEKMHFDDDLGWSEKSWYTHLP